MVTKDKNFFLIYGIVIWALATASFKFIGLDEDLMWLNFLLLVFGMPVLNIIGYRVRKVRAGDKVKASAIFSFSGMLLDAFIVLFYPYLLSLRFFH